MDAEAVAIALDLKRAGKGWRGPCPCCGGSDRAGKFSLSENNTGRLLWHCFAGCRQDDIRAVLTDRGLLDRERERENKPRPRWSRDDVETAVCMVLVCEAGLRRQEWPEESDHSALLRAAAIVGEARPATPAGDLALDALQRGLVSDYVRAAR